MRPCELIHTVNHIIHLVSNTLAHDVNFLNRPRGYAFFSSRLGWREHLVSAAALPQDESIIANSARNLTMKENLSESPPIYWVHVLFDKLGGSALRRADKLDLEAAAVGGLAMAMAGIVEVEDDFAGEADGRFAHVLRLKALWRLDNDLLRRSGHAYLISVIVAPGSEPRMSLSFGSSRIA